MATVPSIPRTSAQQGAPPGVLTPGTSPVCIPGKGSRQSGKTESFSTGGRWATEEGLWSPWERAGEGAEVGVLSPEGCAGISVTKNKVAWPDLQFRKLFLAAVGHSGGSAGGAEGTWVPAGLKKRSQGCGSSEWMVFSRTASEGCGTHR